MTLGYKACCVQDCAVFLYDYLLMGGFCLLSSVQMMAVCFVLVLGSFSPCLSPLSLLADTSSLSSSSASSHPSSSPPLPSADHYTTSQGRSIGRQVCQLCNMIIEIKSYKYIQTPFKFFNVPLDFTSVFLIHYPEYPPKVFLTVTS